MFKVPLFAMFICKMSLAFWDLIAGASGWSGNCKCLQTLDRCHFHLPHFHFHWHHLHFQRHHFHFHWHHFNFHWPVLQFHFQVDQQIAGAFKLWSDVTDLTFTPRNYGRLNFLMSWLSSSLTKYWMAFKFRWRMFIGCHFEIWKVLLNWIDLQILTAFTSTSSSKVDITATRTSLTGGAGLVF